MTPSRNTRRYTPLLIGPVTTAYANAWSRCNTSRLPMNTLTSPTRTTWTSRRDKGSRILELEDLVEMEIWRFKSIGYFLLSILCLGHGPVHLASAWVSPHPEIRLSGGGVSPCTRRSPWMVLISHGTYGIILSYMLVVSVCSTST